MIRKLTLALVVMSALAITAGAALAANPHYVDSKTPTGTINTSTGALSIDFKAAGYGSGQTVPWTLTGTYSITWGCITPSFSNEPSGLTSSSGNISASGNATASRTGTLTGPITVFTPAPFSCPSHNMHPVLVSVSYNVWFTLFGLDSYHVIASYTRP
jgi:hypothetical protein